MLRLENDEVWARLEIAHTGIVTTLRRDGVPISLPVWFAVDGRTLVFSSPTRAKKVTRVKHDHRAAFLVESGRAWRELTAIHMTGRIEFVAPEDAARLDDLVNLKYAAFRNLDAMPSGASAVYADKTFMRFVPDARILSWDNSRIAEER